MNTVNAYAITQIGIDKPGLIVVYAHDKNHALTLLTEFLDLKSEYQTFGQLSSAKLIRIGAIIDKFPDVWVINSGEELQ
jgi:hypothetical protein